MSEMKRAVAREQETWAEKMQDQTRMKSTVVIAAAIIAAVRLARDPDISRPSTRVTAVVSDGVNLARMIFDLFLSATLQELRRQKLTFIAFYALQRIIKEREFFESSLRQETGLDDYEVSRASKFLAGSGLVQISKYEKDKRVCVLTPTRRNQSPRSGVVGGG